MGPRGRRRLIAVVIVLAVVAAGFAGWRLWPRPAAPFSLGDLQGVYAGMVRSDGTNDASMLSRENFADTPMTVDPVACEPLFETTTFSRFPADALDGVGTYWPNDRVAISLFTFRFADPAGAQRQFQQIEAALSACADRPMRILPWPISEPAPNWVRVQSGLLTRTPTRPQQGVRMATAYLFTTDDGIKFAVAVFAYNNLVSWQFRYDPQSGPYDPLAADQLTYSLATQMRSVEESRL
jgi:hypothetical protein